MAHTTRRLAGALAALALVAVGCGDDGNDGGSDDGAVPSATDPPTGTDDGSDEGSDPAGIDPCSLLTDEEVEAAFGVPLTAEFDEQLSTDFQQVCNWRSEDLTAAVQVLLIESGPVADFDRQRESAEDFLEGDVDFTDVDVPGADQAFSMDGLFIGMQVGESYVQVSNISIGEHSSPGITEELAALVAGRL